MDRRSFLRLGGVVAARAVAGSSLWTLGTRRRRGGPVQVPDANGILLPLGFRSRVVARTGDAVGRTGHVWHSAPDGGAVFPTPDGYIYVSNSERSSGGGVGAVRFDGRGRIVDAYPICSGTRRNCAGGATPWGTWLSCEEVSDGLVFECDPTGRAPAGVRPALGRFQHEAVAVDPVRRHLYLTEDRSDGRLYRFTPNVWGRLDGGTLEVAEVSAGRRVRWHPVANPTPGSGQTPTRRQVPQSTAFRGGEGIVWDRGHVYFTTKGDNRVWHYDIARGTLVVLYQTRSDPDRQLSGVDNIAAAAWGDLVVAEDGGNMELVWITARREAFALLRVLGQDASELAGPAFDPSGRRLYFSSQRGRDGRGITYVVEGPFRARTRARGRRRL